MVIDVEFETTNAACNCFGLEQKEDKVTPRRRHYQQYDPETIIILKGFFFVNGFKMRPEEQ